METPSLTSGQMREVDRAMVEDYGIQLAQMMENAGRNLAHLARLIQAADSHGAPVLSLDLPSGLDATTGETPPPVRATATLTLALPKSGLRAAHALPYVGELYLADIGVPPRLYGRPPLNLEVGPLFAREEIVRLP